MKTRNIKYLIWGYYGFGNLGDELMLKVIIKRIREVHPFSLIYVVCKNLPKVNGIFQIGIKKKPGEFLFISRIKYLGRLFIAVLGADKLVIGGGTLFIDSGKHNPAMLMLCVVSYLRSVFSKKIYVVGVGIDKITCSINVWYLKYIIKKSEFTSVRDNFSFNAASVLVGKAGVIKTADILFDNGFVKSFLPYTGYGKKYIALALFDYGRICGGARDGVLFREQSLNLIVDVLNKWGHEYILVLCAFQGKEGGCDYEFLDGLNNSILAEHPTFVGRIIVKYLSEEEEVGEYIGRAIFTISNRYHALVFSAILGVPFVGIQVEMKISEICNEFSMPFVKRNEYAERGISISELGRIKEMTVDGEKVSQNIREAEGNFIWIK